jgi:hypothetical protein
MYTLYANIDYRERLNSACAHTTTGGTQKGPQRLVLFVGYIVRVLIG